MESGTMPYAPSGPRAEWALCSVALRAASTCGMGDGQLCHVMSN